MTTNHFSFRHLSSLILLGLVLSGCTSQVRLISHGSAIIPKTVDLDRMEASYNLIKRHAATPSDIASYNCEVRVALTQLIQESRKSPADWKTLKTGEGRVNLKMSDSRIRGFDLINKILIADTIDIIEGINEMTAADGIGVPLLARIQRTESDPMVPEKGLWIPVTATIDPCGKSSVIRLIDTTAPTCDVPGPVATNFTAPLARDYYDRQKEFNQGSALINFDRFAPEMGINRVFGFDPDKTPVVLVHGVFSSSTTWINAINEMMADPEIRNHFEFWNFRFPTGAPIPFLAKQLREDVDRMHQYRCANGATRRNVIVVGHSMGGLMAKTLTQHSGDRQWNRFFDVPPERLDVSSDEREILRDMFYFEPLPYVDTVVFTATPHRGAEAADWNFVKIVETIIKTPRSLLDATQNVLQTGIDVLTPLGLQTSMDFPNSIQHMKYDSEIGEIFADIPLNRAVKYYSIIASKDGLDVPKEEMSDGVAAYKSCHISGVVFEKIIHSDHGVQRTKEGIAEISRILKLSH